MNQKTLDLFAKLLTMVAPPPRMSVSEWANTYRFIPAEYGAEPGKWDSSRAPYQPEIMEAFTTKGIHKVVAMLAAQLGKSEILFNVLGRFIHLDPCPILLVQPSLSDSEDFSKERLSPTVYETPVLRERISDSKSRDSGNTILKKIFPGGYLAMVGANAPSGLAKRSIRVLLFDEVDRFEKSAGTEGDPIDLASKRTSNFWNYVIGIFSTPTDDFSRIFSEYSLGTQEEWRHSCPSCGEFHWVTLWNMRYEYEAFELNGKKTYRVDAVYWRCPDCGFEFSEQQMKAAKQQYITLNQNITTVRSFHVNAFASPWLS
ncbi:MAG: phage terminase large subunit family protein, partial [Sporomusa sp.]